MDMAKLLKAAAEAEESRSVEFIEYLSGIREKEQNIIKESQDKQRRVIEKEEKIEHERLEQMIDESLERVKKNMREEEERARSLVDMDAETERIHRTLLRNVLKNSAGFVE